MALLTCGYRCVYVDECVCVCEDSDSFYSFLSTCFVCLGLLV